MAKSWGKAAQKWWKFSWLFTSCAVPQSLYDDTMSSVPLWYQLRKRKSETWAAQEALPLSAQVMHTERGIKFTHSAVRATFFLFNSGRQRFTSSKCVVCFFFGQWVVSFYSCIHGLCRGFFLLHLLFSSLAGPRLTLRQPSCQDLSDGFCLCESCSLFVCRGCGWAVWSSLLCAAGGTRVRFWL